MSKAKEALRSVLSASKALIDIVSKEGIKCAGEEQEGSDKPHYEQNPTGPTPEHSAAPSPSEPSPSGEACNGQHKAVNSKDRLKLWVDIAATLVALGVLIIMAYQYAEMRKTTKATLDAVRVSQGQMSIMQRQLEDSESQQRAVLKIEKFEFKKVGEIVWGTGLNSNFGQITLDENIVLKNYGSTPAVDISGEGQMFASGTEEHLKGAGVSNSLQKWQVGKVRQPNPGTGGAPIMAQEAFTNAGRMTMQAFGESIYIEEWFSYRDIFGKAYVVGEAGKYMVSNDTLIPEMIYPVHLGSETNKTANK